MRFVVFSDLHLNSWSYGSSLVNGFNSRLLDQKAVLKQLATYCDENNITDVLFMGDFYHKSKVEAEVLTVAHEALLDLREGRRLLFLTGNHDMSSRNLKMHALSMLSNYGTVADEWYESAKLWALPYTEDQELLNSFLSKCPRDAIVALHQGVSGTEINSKGFTLNEILAPHMVPDHVAFAFAGHYHSHKKVKDNLYIPGSPLQLNWGDKGEKRGWLDVNLETREVKHIESKAPKFIEYTDIDNATGFEGNFIRLLSTSNVDMEEARKIFEGARSIEVIYKKPEVQYEKIERFDTFTGLFEEFIKVNNLSDQYIEVAKRIIND